MEGYRVCSCFCAATYLDHDTCGPWSLFTRVKGVTVIEGWAGTRSCNLPIFAVLS